MQYKDCTSRERESESGCTKTVLYLDGEEDLLYQDCTVPQDRGRVSVPILYCTSMARKICCTRLYYTSRERGRVAVQKLYNTSSESRSKISYCASKKEYCSKTTLQSIEEKRCPTTVILYQLYLEREGESLYKSRVLLGCPVLVGDD